jgi:peptidoglycan/xylan/chitin deacetylase (PgdA/CDA1 family)
VSANLGLPIWKRWALESYLRGTWLVRRRANRRRAAAGRAPVMVLFYHRIAEHPANDWTLPFREFQAQIAWLKSAFDIISLAEAQRRISSGENFRAAVCITFDDGYADNCRRALPLLFRERIPFTYFVASDHVLCGRPFPHDAENGQPLRPNTIEELREIAARGGDVGAHTRSHADLGGVHDAECLVEEIVGCRDDLQRALGHPVRYFAFPYGRHENLTPNAFHVASQAGYRGVCSAYGGYNFPGDDAFHLQRIHADRDMVRLQNWLTVDPRKLRCVQRFDYGRLLSERQSRTVATNP